MKNIIRLSLLMTIFTLPAYAQHNPQAQSNISRPMMMGKGGDMGCCPCCKNMCGGMKEGMMGKMQGMQCMNMGEEKSQCDCCKGMMEGKKKSPAQEHNDSSRYNQ